MSVSRMSVDELRNMLDAYPSNMEVVVLRPPDYSVSSKGYEYDGIESIEEIIVEESWDVYNKVNEAVGHKVLLLSAIPIEDL